MSARSLICSRGGLVLSLAGMLAVVGMATSADASGTPSTWKASGYDAGRSYWDSQETTLTPARVKIMKLNFSIPTAPAPDPTVDCLFPLGPLTSAGRLFDVGPDGISAYNCP